MSTSHASRLLAHESIRASAGSGKTYQLVIRYLRLIAAGAAPANILASTFTRLAAGEIRDRILMRLAGAVDDAENRQRLADDLGVKVLAPREVQAMLVSLVRQLHRMNVRTLDSFFAGVVRCFAMELNVPQAGEMIDESEDASLRAEALQLMLDERHAQELVEILRLLTQGSSERSVMNAMDNVVSSLYELYREAGDEPWAAMPRPRKKDLLAPSQVAEAIDALEVCPIPRDKKNFVKSLASDLAQARRHDWDDFVTTGLAGKIALGESTYYRSPISPQVAAAYAPLVNHAKAQIINRVAEQTVAMRDLLRLFHEHYADLKHRRNAMTFADVTHAMAQAEQLGTMQDIGYRLDAQLHHLLLDEFQDTSIPQWRALEPIAQEIVSNAPPERTFFCVGDVKQSIYSWRSAAPEVLDELPHLLRGDDGSTAVAERSLSRSYRSSPVIMDVVNQVFSSLEGNRVLEGFVDAAKHWKCGFNLHETAKVELPGYACLVAAPRAGEDQKQSLVRVRAAADFITDLHQRNTSMSIAVLTRNNATVARIMFELTRRQVRCSGRGGGPLTDAAPVNAVLDLLQLADHPDDTIAAFNVATSPLGQIVELTNYADKESRQRVARRVRRDLLADGLTNTIARWVTGILPHCDAREGRRLLQLIDLAGQHEDRATLRPTDFIEVVEHTDIADPQAAPVQVMTIHQSKGLEFDAVVLPELDGKSCDLAGRPSQVVFERETPTGRITRISRWIRDELRPMFPKAARIDELFEQHRFRAVRESLCVLYVAMTRAKQGLYMFMDPPAQNEQTVPKRMSSVLRAALIKDEIRPNSIVFELGDPAWMHSMKSAEAPFALKPTPAAKITLRSKCSERESLLLRGRTTRSASAHAESAAFDEAARLDSDARNHGLTIHAMLESIEWLNDASMNTQALQAVVRRAMPRRDQTWARAKAAAMVTMLAKPAIRTLLAKPTTGNPTVLRELPFARFVDGQLQRGVIDRLTVELNDEGLPTSACVIDFKTNPLRDITPHAAARSYQLQLEVYRDAVAQLLKLPVDSIGMKVAFVAAGEVVDLSTS